MSAAAVDKCIAQAEWCPYCRTLQLEPNAFYDAVNAENRQLEIVFVSSDNSESDQFAYLKSKHGPWWTVPFDNEFRNDLKRKYLVCTNKEREQVGISGLPALLILKRNGEIIDRDGVKTMQELRVRVVGKRRSGAQ